MFIKLLFIGVINAQNIQVSYFVHLAGIHAGYLCTKYTGFLFCTFSCYTCGLLKLHSL